MVTPEFFDRRDEFDEFAAFGFGQAAGDLVEEQKPRGAGERARQLEALAAQQIERAGAAVGEGEEPGAFENVAAGIDHLRLALAAAVDRGDQKVLEHGEVLERARNLERAPDAGDAARARRRVRDVAAVEMDRAVVGLDAGR